MLDKRLKTYFEGAQIHVRAHGNGFVIEDRDGAEADAWLQYFEQIVGRVPSTYVTFLNGHSAKAVVPAQWPNQFDASAPDFQRRQKPPKLFVPRPTLQELHAKYGRTYGLTPIEDKRPVRREPQVIDAGSVSVSQYLLDALARRQKEAAE